MQAMVNEEYGAPTEVLKLKEMVKPTPKAGEVLIRVYAASVNAADWHVVRGDFLPVRVMMGGVRRPSKTIPGADVAGRVEAVGPNVTRFKVGDEVFGDLSGCGWGAYAEYVCASETALAHKPTNLSFAETAAVPMAAVTALQGLRNAGQIKAGDKVLVNGASGGVGTFAVQIAKALGAHVTAVCSTRNVAALRALGADHVIDYTKENFTENGQHYDLILAANGYQPIAAYKRSLAPGGRYVMTGGKGKQMAEAMFLGPILSLTGGKKLTNILARPNPDDLAFLKGLIEAGKVKPVIAQRYPLKQAAEALSFVEAGHAPGKVVITLE